MSSYQLFSAVDFVFTDFLFRSVTNIIYTYIKIGEAFFFFILDINLVYRFTYLFYFINIHKLNLRLFAKKKETAPNFSFPFHLVIKARALRTASLISIQGLSLAST